MVDLALERLASLAQLVSTYRDVELSALSGGRQRPLAMTSHAMRGLLTKKARPSLLGASLSLGRNTAGDVPAWRMASDTP
jgi:hypothetical protein